MNQAVSVPPVNTTACDLCIVALGCKVYRWVVGRIGGSKANRNALKPDYPVKPLSGKWIGPNQRNVVTVADTEVVNVGGDNDPSRSKAKILKPPYLTDAENYLVEFLLEMSGEESKLPTPRMPAM